jgi:ribosomal protein S20
MPITTSALKKLRQDKKRSLHNLLIKKQVKKVISEYKQNPTSALYKKVTSFLAKASKKKIFHANKSARLTKRLFKLLNNKKKTTNPPKSKPSSKKTPQKKKSVV